VLNVVQTLPKDRIYDALVRQLVRCSTSTGTNYRPACKEKSEADFVNKLKITEEEADEANYFPDVIANVDRGKYQETLAGLPEESNQLAAIYAKPVATMKSRINARKHHSSKSYLVKS